MKLAASSSQTSIPSSATSANPKRMPKVPTTFSFAISPVSDATADFQLPQPRGAKTHATALPIAARMLSSISTIPNEPSTLPKLEVNQTTTVANRIIVPAFLINDHARSHILRSTLPKVGQWYAGLSMTNGATSPENIFVFFKMMPEQIMAVMPTK